MTLYRVFPWAPRRFVRPLDVPRSRQGANRHDNPDLYTALYLAREPDGAIAEAIQGFRGRTLTDRDLERADGRRLALATLDDGEVPPLVDLDDPRGAGGPRLAAVTGRDPPSRHDPVDRAHAVR